MKTLEPTNPGPDFSAAIELTRAQGVQIADTARSISRIALEVADGSELQSRLLDTASGNSNEMTASMGETTRQLESIASFVEEIVSSVNESAASIEQGSRRLPKRPLAPLTA